MIMNLIQYLKVIYLSFYDKNVYRTVISENFSIIKLALILSVIYSLTVSGKIFYVIKSINLENPQSNLDYTLNSIIDQFPEVRIQNNKLSSSSVQQPTYITDRSNNPLIVIDTSNQRNSLFNSSAYLLLTNNRIIYSPVKGYDVNLEYSALNPNNKSLIITQETIKEFIVRLKAVIFKIVGAFVFPLISLKIFWGINFKAFILAFICFIYFRNHFKKLLKIFITASSPVILLQTIYYLAPKLFFIPGIFFPFISLFYISFALRTTAPYLKNSSS